MPDKITILVADDHPLFIEGVIAVISENNKYEIVGTRADGKSAQEFIFNFHPDIALLDIQMPELDGLQVAKSVIDAGLTTKIILLTMFNSSSLIKKAKMIGVHGFILKENSIRSIEDAFDTVISGNYFSPEEISTSDQFSGQNRSNELTNSEKRILKLIAAGKSSKEISVDLNISRKTVDNHRSNICKKLNLSGPTSLLKYLTTTYKEINNYDDDKSNITLQ